MMRIRVGARMLGMVAAGLLWGGGPVWAQFGDQVVLKGSGSISAGYSGSATNEGPSGHGIAFGGSGDISGSYHSSSFLSFDVSPFYDQSRDDSNSQSITGSSGVTASANIFGGSKFPGYVNYSALYNSEGNYFVPGLANYRTSGDSQSIGVGWSYTPTSNFSLRTGYQQGDSNYSVYGVNGENFSHSRAFFFGGAYNLAGFHMGAGINNSETNNSLPSILTGGPNELNKGDTTTYFFNLSRVLPLGGNTWLNLSRNTSSYDYEGTNDTQSTDTVTTGVALRPLRKLSASFTADYDDNLAGTIDQIETSAGVLAPLVLPSESSHSWGVSGETVYSILDHLSVSGTVSHRQQLFLGTAFDSTAASGAVNYGRDLWGGKFTAMTILTNSTLGTTGGDQWGSLSNAIYSRKIGTWNVSSSAGYSRNTQTLLIAYTSSGYNYSVSATHQLGKWNWNGTAGGSKSVLERVNGSTTTSQTYSTGLSGRRIGASFGYNKSSGLGLSTAQGITSLPTGLPPSLLPTTILYGGTAYSVGVGGSPIRGLTFSGNFVKANSNTNNSSVTSNNENEEANFYLQYRVRKIFFTTGYSRLLQGFSASTAAPAMVTTYYFGLSRWFNFF